jgi:hypothetical protein
MMHGSQHLIVGQALRLPMVKKMTEAQKHIREWS